MSGAKGAPWWAEVLAEVGSADPDQGFGALETLRGVLPLEAMDVEARLIGLSARVEVLQRFRNVFDEPIEATYIFPLPPEAAVSRLQFRHEGRLIEGVIRERGAARDAYDAAIAAGQAAAIAEEERPDVFTLRVGNIAPGGEAEVSLTLVSLLPVLDGEVTFRFPLVVAPRYVPGVPLAGPQVGLGQELDTDAAPDASRISPTVLLPGLRAGVRLSVQVEVSDPGGEISEVSSSLHGVEVTRSGPWLRARLIPEGRLDRDFLLRYAFAGAGALGRAALTTGLHLSPDPEGDGGTWLLHLLSLGHLGRSGRRPRDVVFILDRSGSMAGWKMVSARRATATMIGSLIDEDRFALYAFDHELFRLDLGGEPARSSGSGPARDLVMATAWVKARAREHVEGQEARGGTELGRPLGRAIECLEGADDGEDRERLIVVITDGQVANEDQLLALFGESLRSIRVLAVGIDEAVNAGLLRRFAAISGGLAELVESEDQLDSALRRLHRHLSAAVLRDVEVELEGLVVDVASRAPASSGDLFETAPLVVAGRYQRRLSSARPQAAITGRLPDGQRREVRVDGVEIDAPELRALWARLHLRELEDRQAARPREALEARIVEVSTRHQVLCRYTAWVAVDEGGEPRLVPHGGPRQVLQPVLAPSGWGGFAGGQISARSTRTCCGVLKGKFSHMSPEQVRGERLSWKTDVFSLGLLLWELATGKWLFKGTSDLETLQACVEAKLPEPLLEGPGLEPLEPLLRSMLAREADDRPSPAEVERALSALLGEGLRGEGLAELTARLFGEDARRELRRLERVLAEGPPGQGELRLIARAGLGDLSEAFVGVIAAGEGARVVLAQRLNPFMEEDPEAVELFASQVAVAHPNLVELLEVTLGSDDRTYQLLRREPGVTLAELRRQRSGLLLSPRSIAELGRDVAGGLGALAAADPAGAHREVTSDSVVLDYEGVARLAGASPAPPGRRLSPTRRRVIDDVEGDWGGAGPWRLVDGAGLPEPATKPPPLRSLASRLQFWKR